MVDIVLGYIPPIADNQSSRSRPQPQLRKRLVKDRRKSKADRRQSVRDGVVVTLSVQVERRSGKDRRSQPDNR